VLKKTLNSKIGFDLERQAQEAIRCLLATIPGAEVEILPQARGVARDFDVEVQLRSGRQRLLCEAKSRAWPNELYAIAHRLQQGVRENPLGQAIPVLIAPYLSPQAIQSCDELGLSWADLAGNCELKLEGAYIKVLGHTNPYKSGRGTGSLYSPQSSRVVHALLLEPQRKWTTEELSRNAGVSLGQVSSVKKLLEINSWIRASYGETSLIEPRKLLDDWALHYKPQRTTVRLFTLDTSVQLEERIGSTLSDYAFTELSAAHRYAPYTRHQRVAFYIRRWEEGQALALGLKAGDGASNVTIYETGDELPFIESVNGSRCVSPIQAYLDLRLLPGRGLDAADHLLQTVIEPRWK
jgi:hypothetical protein